MCHLIIACIIVFLNEINGDGDILIKLDSSFSHFELHTLSFRLHILVGLTVT